MIQDELLGTLRVVNRLVGAVLTLPGSHRQPQLLPRRSGQTLGFSVRAFLFLQKSLQNQPEFPQSTGKGVRRAVKKIIRLYSPPGVN